MHVRSKMKRVVLAAVLAFGVLVPAAVPVSATGNCSVAYVRLYQNDGLGGNFRYYCQGVNDADIESEPGNVMGPLANGVFSDDFNSLAAYSGVESYYFYDNPSDGTDWNFCIYYGQNYGTVMGWVGATGGYEISEIADEQAGSFKFTTNISQFGC